MGGPSQGPRRSGPRPEDRGALDSKTVPGGALSQDTLLPTCEGGGPWPLTTRNPMFPGPRLRAVPLAQPGLSGHLPSGQHLPGRRHPEPWPTDPQPTHRGRAMQACPQPGLGGLFSNLTAAPAPPQPPACPREVKTPRLSLRKPCVLDCGERGAADEKEWVEGKGLRKEGAGGLSCPGSPLFRSASCLSPRALC